jgi:hypothetical protein
MAILGLALACDDDLDHTFRRSGTTLCHRISWEGVMIFRELDTVVLERDIPESGLRKGDTGAIVHVHGDSRLEVEFVRASGRTRALLQLAATDVRPVQDEDIPAARAGTPPRRGAA